MPPYSIDLSRQAEQVLGRMARREPAIYQRVAAALDDLARDPFRGKGLKGPLGGRRSYRVGSYRILYRVRPRRLLVFVIDVGHRREIYR